MARRKSPARRTARRALPRAEVRPMPAPAPAAAPAPAMARSWSVLTEPPHAHIVCRACGRIAPFPLDTESELRLERLATRRPEGWSVELISFSVTGACARCRMGLSPTE